MIGHGIDLRYWRGELALRSRVQVPGWLQDDAAQLIHRCLAEELRWDLAHRTAAGSKTVKAAELAVIGPTASEALSEAARQLAQTDYAFAYDVWQMVSAYRSGREPGLPLHRVLEFLNSPEFLAFARELTSEPRIRRTSAQATRYRPGQFLNYHTDIDSQEGRLYAYVINLTREWRADWGGLLQFIDDSGAVVETFLPRWNSLSLFRVPQGHAVSLVAPWARQPRLAITGWFMA